MPRRAAPAPLDLDEIRNRLTEGLRNQVIRPNLYGYRPHKKQYDFHTSEKKVRLYIGGNRSGKTVGGAVESCFWLMKKHPYRRLPLPEGPVRGRGIAVDFDYGVDVLMLPEIQRWMPPSYLINGSWEDSYDRTHRLLTLANKSFMEFRSYAQELDKHAGTSRHFEWFDEEPPQHIYNENQMRLLDTDGSCWLTMTPVEGITWTYEDLYLRGLENPDGSIGIIEIETTENPHLSPEAIERVMGELTDEERKARQRGEYISVGGRIFKMFSEEIHVVDSFIPPSDWEIYTSFDHGYNNPTAILWHAVSPDDKIVTFAEHYKSEWTVDQHAARFWEMVKEFGREPDFIVGDPAINQRNGVTGTSIKQEYADQGIYIADGNNEVLSGINRMVRYLKTIGPDEKPKWTITGNCTNLIKEMKKLRWATFQSKKSQFENNKQEKIHKKDDHACDSARYFFSFMPDLSPPESDDSMAKMAQKSHQNTIGAKDGYNASAGSWDALIAAQKPKEDSAQQWETTYGYE